MWWNKSHFLFKCPGAGKQKQAPLTATFQTRSARNVDRDIQLPDGHITTRPLCCFPLLRLQGHKHISTCAGPHMSAYNPSPSPTLTNTWAHCVQETAWGQGVKLGFNINILLSLFVYTVCCRTAQLYLVHWDILGHGIDHGMVGIKSL